MEIVLNSPLDMHVHLRDNELLKKVAKYTSKFFSAALVMPNIVPPVDSKEKLFSYKEKILDIVQDDNFLPLMTLFFKNYTYDFLKKIKDSVFAIKLYPAGITTNSENGVEEISISSIGKTLEIMEELGMVLSIHGESSGFVLDREKDFLPIYEKIAKTFPKLKIVMEHITTKEAVELLKKYENLYATVTLHHLKITLNDVIGGYLKPHLFCKPIAKTEKDKEALTKLVCSGFERVFFGSDSAPHLKNKKESSSGAAGIFSAPILLNGLAEIFEQNDSLEKFEKFVCKNALKVYNLKNIPSKKVVLTKEETLIPQEYEGIVPLFAGKTLSWSIKSVY